jgi:hypothetical protein
MSSDVFDFLLERDLETLVESDTALSRSEDRRRLLDAVLKSAGTKAEFEVRHRRRGELAKLKFDLIDEPLRSVIFDRTQPNNKRLVAIQVARDCENKVLINDFVSICIDGDESERIRMQAAYVLRDLGDPSACLGINALVSRDLLDSQGLSTSAIDEIRGCAFTCEARVRSLSEASWSQVSEPVSQVNGAYKTFLSHHFAELNSEDVLHALRWLNGQQRWSGEFEFEFDSVETHILICAWRNLDDLRVANAYAKYYVDRATGLRSIFGERRYALGVRRSNDEVSDELVSETEKRHTLLIAIVENLSKARTSEDRTVSFVKQYSSLIVPIDFEWLVQQVGAEHIAWKQDLWIEFALWAMDASKSEQVETIWRLKLQGIASKLLSEVFDSVELGSEKAKNLRLHWEAFYAPPDHFNDKIRIGEFHGSMVNALGNFKSDDHAGWWRIQLLLNFDGRHKSVRSDPLHDSVDPAERPAWNLLDHDTRQRIFNAAHWFVQYHEPDSEWQGTNQFVPIDLSGMSAFAGLLLHQEELLANLDNEVWVRWGKMFLFYPARTSETENLVRDQLLERSVQAGFDIGEYLDLVATRITAESDLSLQTAIKAAFLVLGHSDWERVVRRFLNPMYGTAVNWVAINSLILLKEVGDGTWESCLELATIWLENPLNQANAIRLGARLMADAGPEQVKTEVWRTFFGSESLRKQFIEDLVFEDRPQHRTLASLPDRDLVELFEYMEAIYPSSEDPPFESGWHSIRSRESIADYRDAIPNNLANRSSWEAVNLLRNLAVAYPDNRRVGFALAEARESARVASRPTPRVEDLLQIALTPSLRIVDSPQALQNAIIESLARLQIALKGSPPKAAGWWNNPWVTDQRALNRGEAPAPKWEKDISDEVVLHIREDLKSRIVAHREIEDRRRNIVDILIDAVAPQSVGKNDIITVPCEVKGCWNEDLYTSMESQLYERYLKQSGYSHGVYLVVFFDCDRWWRANRQRRHKNQRSHSLESIREVLDQQAKALSKSAITIRVVVLDATL